MYPPVALISIHGSTYSASRHHEHLKIYFAPKLSSQPHIKYGNNLITFEFTSKVWTFLLIYFGGSLGTVCWIQGYQSIIKTSSHWRHKFNSRKIQPSYSLISLFHTLPPHPLIIPVPPSSFVFHLHMYLFLGVIHDNIMHISHYPPAAADRFPYRLLPTNLWHQNASNEEVRQHSTPLPSYFYVTGCSPENYHHLVHLYHGGLLVVVTSPTVHIHDSIYCLVTMSTT